MRTASFALSPARHPRFAASLRQLQSPLSYLLWYPRHARRPVSDPTSRPSLTKRRALLVTQTRTNTPTFQSKLRALKEKRGWSNDQLIKEGAAFVRDDKIAAYDEQSEQLLLKINTQGGDSADCKVLADLKSSMGRLVEAQQAKWKYMFDKIDTELAR